MWPEKGPKPVNDGRMVCGYETDDCCRVHTYPVGRTDKNIFLVDCCVVFCIVVNYRVIQWGSIEFSSRCLAFGRIKLASDSDEQWNHHSYLC